MNLTLSKNKKIILVGGVFIISLMAFKYFGSIATPNEGNAIQSAGFNTNFNSRPKEPCVAEQFRQRLPENANYRPIKWSKATRFTNIPGADSVIVHGYQLVNSKGENIIYTKLIYFNDNCEVIYIE